MTLTHLIPLSQFVDKIDEIVPRDLDQELFIHRWSQLKAIKRYTAFILQNNAKWMFVPVSDSGEVLEEPTIPHIFSSENIDSYIKQYKSQLEAYNKAKEKCLFEGFELINDKLFLNEKLIWFGELKGKV